MKFDIRIFFENLSKKFKFHSTLTRIKVTVSDDLYAITLKSHCILPRKRIFQTKFVEKIRTRILCLITFSPKIVPLTR